ncbi:hypothetical protein BC332_33287 [Capsicum chinense]|nr:hypothetical protein BC332_33287 [Capsicum chinense]
MGLRLVTTGFLGMKEIFIILGTPNGTIWEGFSEIPGVKVNFVKHSLPSLGDSGLSWLSGLLWCVRRVMNSPDPCKEQQRKELKQGVLGTGGLFG